MGLECFRHNKEKYKNDYVNLDVVESNLREYNRQRGYRKYAVMLDDLAFEDLTNRRISIIDLEA